MGERRDEEGTAEGSGGGRSWEEITEGKAGGGKTSDPVRSLGEPWGTFGQCMGITGTVAGMGLACGELKSLRQGPCTLSALADKDFGGEGGEDTHDFSGPALLD